MESVILQKKKIIKKTVAWKLVPGTFVFARIKHSLFWKKKLLKEATYTRHVLAKLSKFVQISTLTSSDSFLQKIPWKLKKVWSSFQGRTFHIIFWSKIYFAILHKLAKFHYQTVFTSHVSPVSWLGIWWHHNIWIPEKFKFDYLKNKSFQSKIKNIKITFNYIF